jgi:hypothetical protein
MAKTETKTITVKVKHHPNEYLYLGRQCRDHLNGIMKFMASGKSIPDLEMNKEWLKKVKIDDIVGLEHSQYKITALETDCLSAINAMTKQEVRITPEDLTMAVGSGFAEILYRKGKPFGIKSTKKVKFTIIDHSVKDEKIKDESKESVAAEPEKA